MRLQFSLKKIKVSPTCHIQIARHAQQFQNKFATGQLYGALYQDEAQITNIMPFPEVQKMSTKQQLQLMEKRHQQYLNKFYLDDNNLGWYMICYKQNFWDGLEAVQYYEKFINTSFFLVYDYKARVKGANPYKAYRLIDQFALKTDFSWKDLQNLDPAENNPFEQIPVVVKKNQLFNALMVYNKKQFLKNFSEKRKQGHSKEKGSIEDMVQDYIESVEQQMEMQKKYNEYSTKQNSEKAKKDMALNQYWEYAGQQLKIKQQQDQFKSYHKDLKNCQKILSKQE